MIRNFYIYINLAGQLYVWNLGIAPALQAAGMSIIVRDCVVNGFSLYTHDNAITFAFLFNTKLQCGTKQRMPILHLFCLCLASKRLLQAFALCCRLFFLFFDGTTAWQWLGSMRGKVCAVEAVWLLVCSTVGSNYFALILVVVFFAPFSEVDGDRQQSRRAACLLG